MTKAKAAKTQYEAVIGLETHCQLSTATKIFCDCSTEFGSDPNENICFICVGMPGVLPVLNEKVLEYAVQGGQHSTVTSVRTASLTANNIFILISPRTIKSHSLTCLLPKMAGSKSNSWMMMEIQFAKKLESLACIWKKMLASWCMVAAIALLDLHIP